MSGVRAQRLGKQFRGRWVLSDLTFAVGRGECLAVVGPNGAGKSTLLRCVAGLMRADRGTLTVAGWDSDRHPGRLRRAVGVALGEERSWYLRLSGRRNLEFFAALYPGRGSGRRVEHLLELVGLADDADRRVNTYSTGMRARLGLARALLPDPSVLVLDEPTRSLDDEGRSLCHDLLRQRMAEHGTCVVIASHDGAETAGLAGTVLHLGAGMQPSASTSESLR